MEKHKKGGVPELTDDFSIFTSDLDPRVGGG